MTTKNYLKLFFTILLFGLIFTTASCSSDENGSDGNNDDNPTSAIAGNIDEAFNTTGVYGLNGYLGAYGYVRAIAVQPDGKILVVGNFNEINEQPHTGLVRLNVDGSIDTTFNVGTGSIDCSSIALQPDGKILIGGRFFQFNGESYKGLVRLNVNGSIDTSFSIGTGFGDYNGGVTDMHIHTIALQPDGKILAGGEFYQFNGQPHKGLVRLNADGSLDTSFDIEIEYLIRSFALQPDGKILVTYSYLFNGQRHNNLVRLNTNGNLDTSFDIGTFTKPNENISSVSTMVLKPDGKILVGGDFVQFNGQPRKGLVRLNADGSIDTSFNNFNTDSGRVFIYTIALQSDGNIIVGGDFATNNHRNRGLARLNADGSLDAAFKGRFETYGGEDVGVVVTIALQSDGKILAGGNFTSYRGRTRIGIVRLHN